MSERRSITREELAAALKTAGRVIVPLSNSALAAGVSDGIHEVFAALPPEPDSEALRAALVDLVKWASRSVTTGKIEDDLALLASIDEAYAALTPEAKDE
jgi:hypothetical protein